MRGPEGNPPAAVMMAQIIHEAAIARITCGTSDKGKQLSIYQTVRQEAGQPGDIGEILHCKLLVNAERQRSLHGLAQTVGTLKKSQQGWHRERHQTTTLSKQQR